MEFYSKPACQQTGKSGDFRYLLPTRRPAPACRQTGKSCLYFAGAGALDENISEEFIDYYDLVISLSEDTLTWLQIDSASVLKLKEIALIDSDIALYALAALELRGDTIIKRHPEDSYGGSSQRLSFFEEETKPMKTVSKLEIYPNPGRGDFNLRMNGLEGLTDISVYDLSGRRLLYQRVNFINNNPIQLTMNGYNSGIYFVELRQNGVFQSAGKLIVE